MVSLPVRPVFSSTLMRTARLLTRSSIRSTLALAGSSSSVSSLRSTRTSIRIRPTGTVVKTLTVPAVEVETSPAVVATSTPTTKVVAEVVADVAAVVAVVAVAEVDTTISTMVAIEKTELTVEIEKTVVIDKTVEIESIEKIEETEKTDAEDVVVVAEVATAKTEEMEKAVEVVVAVAVAVDSVVVPLSVFPISSTLRTSTRLSRCVDFPSL